MYVRIRLVHFHVLISKERVQRLSAEMIVVSSKHQLSMEFRDTVFLNHRSRYDVDCR